MFRRKSRKHKKDVFSFFADNIDRIQQIFDSFVRHHCPSVGDDCFIIGQFKFPAKLGFGKFRIFIIGHVYSVQSGQHFAFFIAQGVNILRVLAAARHSGISHIVNHALHGNEYFLEQSCSQITMGDHFLGQTAVKIRYKLYTSPEQ